LVTVLSNETIVGTLAASTIARVATTAHTYRSAEGKPIMEIIEREPLVAPTQAEIDEESRMIRRLRILVQLTVETIAEGGLSPEEASGMIAATRKIALEMFPGKDRAFDMLYRPQFQRVMHAIYRLQ
jgi:hypothetical protein